jgi:hypothetical protein
MFKEAKTLIFIRRKYETKTSNEMGSKGKWK